jgi:hypothetical protein
MSYQGFNPIVFSKSENSAHRASSTFLCARSVISHNPSARQRQARQPVIVKPDENNEHKRSLLKRAAYVWQLPEL